MNERIRELAEQAGFLSDISVGLVAGPDANPHKFAELIVRECIMLQYRRGVEGFGVLEERMLKEHFGVKE